MLALVAACAGPIAPVPVPPARPERPEPPAELTEASRKVAAHFARVQAELLDQGLLRTDGGGRDTPFNERQLTENFVRIALYDEYADRGGALIPSLTPSRLRRWQGPINVSLRFGDAVPMAQRATDAARIASFVQRLARLTGHPIRMSDTDANFFVYVVTEDDRRALGPELSRRGRGLRPGDIAQITDLPLSTFCLVYAVSEGNSPTYTRAVAVIRAEHPDLLRLSCIHEEMAQGLGLANDSPSARPSIFNDDEEFALLTRQDELMLKMLYDPRLRPGMTEAEARPIVEALAAALIGGES